MNKIEDKITFKIKTKYYSKLLIPETMKLLGSIDSENVSIKDTRVSNRS